MRLRNLLFLALCGIALLPVLALAAWDVYRAHEREIRIVEDTHLLLARNLGAALDRYARDVRSTFELAARSAMAGEPTERIQELLRDLDFVHLCIADARTGVIDGGVMPERFPCPPRVPEARFDLFSDLARSDRVVFTPVLPRPTGQPTLYVLRRYGNLLAIGAIDTRYIADRGREIAFGKRGHAAIVDHTGKLLAHPLDDWIAEMKDISVLPPVRQMLAGMTGTTVFFSPALKAEMVAGYTQVPGTGWGVMIPQPLAEIEADANQAALGAAGIGLAGIAVAAGLAWLLSGLLTAALGAVSSAATRMTHGELEARVGDLHGVQPAEIRELATSFDAMAGTLAAANANLSEALRRAEDAGAAKTRFLTTISHEIRTPLTGLIGGVELLLASDLDERQRQLASSLDSSAKGLFATVSDVLDMSRIEAGKMTIEPGIVSPRALLDGIAAELAPRAEAKGLTLSAELEEAFPEHINTDPLRVRQIVVNLVDNAIKFTERGWVRVSVRSFDDPGGSRYASITVRDTGIGIDDSVLPSLFAPFVQGDARTTRVYDGTGLGLTISDTLARLLGGRLEAHSTVGDGSTFRLLFPLVSVESAVSVKARTAPPASRPAAPARPVERQGARPRILVAEDHKTNRWMLSLQLEAIGLEADLAEDGAEALEAYRAGTYDLLITDYLMPRLDGIQLTQAIRDDEKDGRPRLTILGLTANAFRDALDSCLAAGMDDILTKPITQDTLRDAIEALLGPGVTAPAAPPAAGETPTRPAAPDPGSDGKAVLFDDGPLNELFSNDPASGRLWLGDFMETVAAKRDALRHARDQSDRPENGPGDRPENGPGDAPENGRGDGPGSDIVRELHALKGVAGAAGARRLAAVAERVHAAQRAGTIADLGLELDTVCDEIAMTIDAIERYLQHWPHAKPGSA